MKITSAKPEHIPTGVRKTTIVNPVFLPNQPYYSELKNIDTVEGNPTTFKFNAQENNYQQLLKVLKRNNQKFDWIGAARYTGSADYTKRYDNPNAKATLTRFVCTAPSLIWEKYEGLTAGGGRNVIYVGGTGMKLTSFFELSPKKQDAYIKGQVDSTTQYRYFITFSLFSDMAKKTEPLIATFCKLTNGTPLLDIGGSYRQSEYKTEDDWKKAKKEADRAFGDNKFLIINAAKKMQK